MKNSIKIDDLGVPLFLETPIFTFSKPQFEIMWFSQHQVGPNRHTLKSGVMAVVKV